MYRNWLFLFVLSAWLIQPNVVYADFYKSEKVKATATVKSQYLYEDNRNLGTVSDDDTSSVSVEGRVKTEIKPTDALTFYFDARGVKIGGDLFEDSVTGETIQEDQFLQLRQAWVSYDIQDHTSVKLGRQRIRDRYGLWWNDDQDAISVSYDTTQFSGLLGIGENLFSYNTADNEFQGDEEDRFRIFAEGSWMTPVTSRVELRALYEDDHSGTPAIGANLTRDERDDEDGTLFWVGGRIHNKEKPINFGNNDNILTYRADVIGVTGEIEDIATVAGPGSTRTVTGANTVDVLAWAFDGQVDLTFNQVPFKPVVTLGYAYGSGDDDNGADGESNSFIQSDLESNTSNDIGSSRSVHNYGEVLRPELSNLHVVKAGTTLNLSNAVDLSLIYRNYKLADEGSQLRSSRVSQNVNGNDTDVGQEIDLIFNMDVGEQFDIESNVLDGVKFRSSIGAFIAGDAYSSSGDDESIVRGLAEIQVKF